MVAHPHDKWRGAFHPIRPSSSTLASGVADDRELTTGLGQVMVTPIKAAEELAINKEIPDVII